MAEENPFNLPAAPPMSPGGYESIVAETMISVEINPDSEAARHTSSSQHVGEATLHYADWSNEPTEENTGHVLGANQPPELIKSAYELSNERRIVELDTQQIEIIKLNDGLGYGSGTISAAALREEFGDEAFTAADEVINSPDILVAIDIDKNGDVIDDDGCGDGRGVKRVYEGRTEKQRSLNRAKVFGGGAAMAAATLVGLGRAMGQKTNKLFTTALGTLKDKMLNFGAHTADQVADDKDSGCGAIDRAPEAIQAAVTYREQIQASIEALGVSTDGLEDVFNNYTAYAEEITGEPYSGRQVIEEIIDSGKIVKQLEGRHVEGRIVLNKKRGYTVNQSAVRKVTNGKVDTFAVDVWRLEDYANALYDDPTEQHKAFLSELVYSLATAAVLTAGDQPVYVIDDAPALVGAA